MAKVRSVLVACAALGLGALAALPAQAQDTMMHRPMMHHHRMMMHHDRMMMHHDRMMMHHDRMMHRHWMRHRMMHHDAM